MKTYRTWDKSSSATPVWHPGAARKMRPSRGRGTTRLHAELLESRWLMTGTGFAGNECAPDLVLTAVPAQTATVGNAFTLNLRTAGGTTADLNLNGTATGNTIRFVLDTDDNPTGATITAAGVFTWTPTSAQVGSHTIMVIAIDTGTPLLGDAESFVIDVTGSAPVVDLNGGGTGTGSTASFIEDGGSVMIVEADLTVTDADSANLASDVVLAITFIAFYFTEETFHKDLNYTEAEELIP